MNWVINDWGFDGFDIHADGINAQLVDLDMYDQIKYLIESSLFRYDVAQPNYFRNNRAVNWIRKQMLKSKVP